MKLQTKVRAGALTKNHAGVKVKTKVRAGGGRQQHNGVKVKTNVRAGFKSDKTAGRS